ncbi:MAG TPA: SH3 domain-containing protein [Anaerolineales bacterium]|nr:SH3 domain-containing protein [Anaerolineales bacterium]
MSRRQYLLLALLCALFILLAALVPLQPHAHAQQPTGSVPTVTSTPGGPIVSVDPSLGQIDVYAGPGSFNYPPIGVLLTGDKAPALGRARGDDNWIMIRYEGVPGSVGWVYALYVSLTNTSGVALPLIDIPPTPTPAFTPTINPTLVAAYIPPENATRLPTYTAPAPLAIPTFVDQTQRIGRIPVGLLIFGFAVVGALGTMISFLRGR